MARIIEYLIGNEPNYVRGFGYPGSWSACSEAPADIDLIRCLRIDHEATTENVATLWHNEARVRWILLAGTLAPPDNMSIQSAVAFAEIIWLDSLICAGISMEFGPDKEHFSSVMMLETERRLNVYGNEIELTGFDELALTGASIGVARRIAAWTAGTPISDVLAS